MIYHSPQLLNLFPMKVSISIEFPLFSTDFLNVYWAQCIFLGVLATLSGFCRNIYDTLYATAIGHLQFDTYNMETQGIWEVTFEPNPAITHELVFVNHIFS